MAVLSDHDSLLNFTYADMEVYYGSGVTPNPPTGATAGTPGTYTPADAIPYNITALRLYQPTADPGTPWTPGQYVPLGNGSSAYWDGANWKPGKAPTPATGATAGAPGTFTPSGSAPPKDLAGAASITASPTTKWTTGQYVTLGDGSDAYWDGDSWEVGKAPAPPATGATAGKPGSFTPAGSVVPANPAGMTSITASPTTKWTTDQYVVLGDSSQSYWDGTAWKSGKAPAPPVAATGATAGTPGTFTPAGSVTPANLAGMSSVVASPVTAWTPGQSVVLGDDSDTYWDGDSWEVGTAPTPPPAPVLDSLDPDTVASGTGVLTIHLLGSNFAADAYVTRGVGQEDTTFVSDTELTIEYDPTATGIVSFQVFNPGNPIPSGTQNFEIT